MVWVSYEPAVVQLGGTLVTRVRYGPPNYGEDTARDQRIEVPLLLLSRPISVRGDSTSETNRETFRDVWELQLVFPVGDQAPASLFNRTVVATGTLSRAISGHHFTEVVLMVKTLVEGRRR
jgi:hypothetical protein